MSMKRECKIRENQKGGIFLGLKGANSLYKIPMK